ncbi:hypothetical protein A8L34_27915 [Bacillus sp. FJAT-27264]|nr:hypothetical protein A8L34_27915 [Bacillus sp. FJAT-27264]
MTEIMFQSYEPSLYYKDEARDFLKKCRTHQALYMPIMKLLNENYIVEGIDDLDLLEEGTFCVIHGCGGGWVYRTRYEYIGGKTSSKYEKIVPFRLGNSVSCGKSIRYILDQVVRLDRWSWPEQERGV